ncbi:hypothetical protein [Flavihumibacter sp. CACIAM 22H1]|uniref:hypothetical protein n=1 Tax=Flavihumibacter sp. CACIAM 22H1 TaxID=1812911 RepID=UPI0007A7CBB5|nr:hypothetical protein [Flavihumibacter sp. CACIAM 22H1]KYP14725.1 MAG: hypothetical protein A1D16_14910 [Flavihumibacter sp. CACIAM 22H1]
MYTGLLHLHSFLRWIILILLLVAIYRHFTGMNKKLSYSGTDRKVDLFLMISAHITLLIGLYQWVAGPWGLKLIQAKGFGEVMKTSAERFFAVEHFVGMLVVIALITVARGKGKPSSAGPAEHKKAFGLLVAALLLLLLLVPWPFREELGRGWLAN